MPTSPDDQSTPRPDPDDAPDQASVNRSRQQGLGLGARELAMQGDPEAADAADTPPVHGPEE